VIKLFSTLYNKPRKALVSVMLDYRKLLQKCVLTATIIARFSNCREILRDRRFNCAVNATLVKSMASILPG